MRAHVVDYYPKLLSDFTKLACKTCSRVIPNDYVNVHYCPFCKQLCTEEFYIFMGVLMLRDSTSTIPAILYGSDAESFFGKKADNLITHVALLEHIQNTINGLMVQQINNSKLRDFCIKAYAVIDSFGNNSQRFRIFNTRCK